MLPTWMHQFESLEEISQNEATRRIFLRMAAMRRHGRLANFLTELDDDPDVDDATKGSLSELAHDATFLIAVEDYCAKTDRLH